MEANYLQERMNELQKSEEFSGALGKLLSGKASYKPVIERKKILIKCSGCGMIFENPVKFCQECGTKIEMPKKE